MQFKPTTLSVSDITSKQDLDNIALLQAGVVGSIGYGAQTHGSIKDAHGYGFRWVNRKGMGNHGMLVLIAKNAEAANNLRLGRVAKIMADHGVSSTTAVALFDAAKGVKYGMEDSVIAYAIATQDRMPSWRFFPGLGKGVWRWMAEFDMPASDLSAQRLAAVAEILNNLHRS